MIPASLAYLREHLPKPSPSGRGLGEGLSRDTLTPALSRRERELTMRICFVSRRFFPAISGMSVYALNLLRELVEAGHDVTMISQYRGDAFGKRVYGGGPPPEVPGVRVIGLEQLGEQDGGDFERDVEAIRATIVAEHRARAVRHPACAVRLSLRLGGDAGLARYRRAERRLDPGRRRPLGRQLLRDPPPGDDPRARPCRARC